MSNPEDGGGLLIGEGLAARGDEGSGLCTRMYSASKPVASREMEGAEHTIMALCLCTRRTASRHARALAGLGSWWERLRGTMVRYAQRRKAA